ncbi:glycosyltransferase family 4 protein [Cryobacterium sp. PH29-G1]|uniref:glycosyltransferase family 4 protein n=1 Tax=Cryobacterium sp. PH29-G1 TaxID=3046211 RepID=UPI0024B99E54|nr:glycosyltransferase family 4 protein [Cryobacterium sp. PH29-G1]MDJ0350805.1 glycosyltransferase family 4 protein [Cryobacterium sp. PH29-G1]
MRPNSLISILSLHFPPESTGNAPYVGSLTEGLRDQNFNVRVLTGQPHYPDGVFRAGYRRWRRTDEIGGAKVTRLRHFLPRMPTSSMRLLSEVSFGIRLLFARWGAADVVVLVSPALFSTAIAMLRAKCSLRKPAVVVWVQDLYSLGVMETGAGGIAVQFAMKWVESKTLKSATKVVVIHSRFATYLVDVLGVDPTRVEVIRNWTHLAAAPEPNIKTARAGHGWSHDETVVLHAGNMGGKQGLENVVDAARLAEEQKLPIRFVLLGNGNQRKALEEYAQGIERLQFLDSLGDDLFQAALASADILLVNEKPGVSEMSVPSKLTSYFGAGRPVLAATDPHGVTAAEINLALGGLVIQSGEPQLLIDACMELRDHPQQASLYAENGLRYRRDVLGQAAAIDQFSSLFLELLQKRRV